MQKNKQKMVLFLLLLLVAIFTPVSSVKADAGPKSSMKFNFQFPDDKISITKGELLICPDKDCAKFESYEGYFGCTSNSCLAYPQGGTPRKYDYSYYKMIITFTDGVRDSNVFQQQGFSAQYEVTFQQSHLIVKEDITLGSMINPFYVIFFVASVILTIPVETIIALIYFWITKVKKSFLLMVVFANVLSLSIIWFIFPMFFKGDFWVFMVIAETFVVAFEAIFLFITGRNFRFPIIHAISLSLVMNLASFLLGWWLIGL